MDNNIHFDYYYGNEAEQFSFYRIPRILIKDERFKGISSDAKLLYGLMLDRMALSVKNGWFDEQNRAYIHYTMENVMDDLCCGREKCCKIFKELDTKHGIGLIEKKRQGLGKPDIIYVKNFLGAEEDVKPKESGEADELQEVGKSDFKEYDSDYMRSTEIELQKKDESQEIGESNFCHGKNHTSRSTETELVEVPESNSKYNYNNYNKMSYINLINQSEEDQADSVENTDGIDEIDGFMQLIRDNLDYVNHMQYDDTVKKDLLEEIYQTICDVVCVRRKTVRIGGEDYPYELVKARFLKLNYSHAEYVIDRITKNLGKISNIKSYIITSLYNAPTTMNLFIQQEVQHDMYGGGWNEKGVV